MLELAVAVNVSSRPLAFAFLTEEPMCLHGEERTWS